VLSIVSTAGRDMSVPEFSLPPSQANGPLPHIPDNLTLPQFMLDTWHPTRPVNKHLNPVLIEDTTGKKVGFAEVRCGEHWECLGRISLGL
jgi:hypothetical protein